MKTANKFSLKSANDKIAIFWRRVLSVFILSLILIFLGQAYWLWSISTAWPKQTPSVGSTTSANLDRSMINRLFFELESRPDRLATVLASSTILIDPSR